MKNKIIHWRRFKGGLRLFLIYLILSGWGFLIDKAEANNLSVSNVSLTNVSLIGGTATVQFTISWANSWWISSAPGNYDAAWVFIKYSTDSGSTWSHATLKTSGTNPTGFSAGTGTALNIIVPTDKKGAFLQRSAAGSGSVSTSSIQFVWDYATDNVSRSATAIVKVFAIEMVYIPQGSFSTGGSNDTSLVNCGFYPYGSATSTPWTITSESQITVATAGGLDYPVRAICGGCGDRSGPIPAAFPKGYAAFYMMKYEISQGQYADFLNTLTSTQALKRYPSVATDTTWTTVGAASYRYTITGSHPNYTAGTKADRACNWLSWADIVAYADWAGLRPMTELEFEKAARGPSAVVAHEYAWGSISITATTAASISKAPEDGTETITTGNCNYNNITWTSGDQGQGPLRCGIFATTTSVRWTAGAGYYGVMELSGNLWEVVVPVGNTAGRAFTGLHGDGALDADACADVTNWPGRTAAENAYITAMKGGNWQLEAAFEQVSFRLLSSSNAVYRSNAFGARLVRTAP